MLSNVLELDLGQRLMFASYGVLGWIPDVAEWMYIASRHLNRGIDLLNSTRSSGCLTSAGPLFPFARTRCRNAAGPHTDGGEDGITSAGTTPCPMCWLARQAGLEGPCSEHDHSPYPLAGMVERAPGERLRRPAGQRLPTPAPSARKRFGAQKAPSWGAG